MVSVEAPLNAAVAAQVVPQGSGDAQDIDAPMGLEALVFNGDDGLAQDRRKVVVVDDHAPLEGKGTDDAAFAVVEIGGGGGAVALKVVNLGQIDGVDQHEAGEGAGDDGQEEQGDECYFAGHLPAPEKRDRLRLEPMSAAQTARLRRSIGGGSQELQASWASCKRIAEDSLSLRLAWLSYRSSRRRLVNEPCRARKRHCARHFIRSWL